ncbi:MAG TPA: hypothetical protein VGI14_22000 [Casimicrobiaceae bacterium]|jgi:hypothetical protein
MDVIGALVVGLIVAVDVVALVGLADIPPRARAVAAGLAAAWLAGIVGFAALGGFAPGAAGPVPTPVVPFAVFVIAGAIAWNAWPAFRAALLSVPLSALVGINVFRVAGAFFVLLWMQDRLAAPFAPSAGFGDVITGLVAMPLALAIARGRIPSRARLALWNAFGTLDLVAAIAFGALSAPGAPFRIFTHEPGTLAMTMLPWVIVPTFLVPLYLLTHLIVATRLRALHRGDTPMPLARGLPA